MPTSEPPLHSTLSILRRRLGLIVAITLAATIVATLYDARASDVYEANADILVTPVPGGDPQLVGLGLLRESADPTRDVQTVARLTTSQAVALRAASRLGEGTEVGELLTAVSAVPVAQSNVVTVRARAESAALAARTANTLADSLVQVRTEQMRSQIDRVLRGLRERAGPTSGAAEQEAIADQIAGYVALRGGQDPTLRVVSAARADTPPVSPSTRIRLFAGALAGLLLGLVGAFAWAAVTPRLQTEEQVRELTGLPVVARVPLQRRSRDGIGAGVLGRPFYDGIQVLVTARNRPPYVLACVAAERGTGTTSGSASVASAIAAAGHRVLLVETDVQAPELADLLGVDQSIHLGTVLEQRIPLDDLPRFRLEHGELSVLPAPREDHGTRGGLSGARMVRLFAEAKLTFDFVIVDLPPLGETPGAVPLLGEADGIVLFMRMGWTRTRALATLLDLLRDETVPVLGVAVLDAPRSGRGRPRRERVADSRATDVVVEPVGPDQPAASRARRASHPLVPFGPKDSGVGQPTEAVGQPAAGTPAQGGLGGSSVKT